LIQGYVMLSAQYLTCLQDSGESSGSLYEIANKRFAGRVTPNASKMPDTQTIFHYVTPRAFTIRVV
jgi:hypothetical protein